MNGAPRDSVALVTGASRGIGRAVALTLGRHGCAVAVNCREQTAAAEATAAAIRAAGGRAMAFTADVRDFAAVRAMVAAVTRELGEPDILINNAGIVRDKPLAFTTDEEWNAVVDTNLKGAFHGIKAVAKIMARRKRGRIVNISSVAGLTGDVLRAGYAAAKSGLIGLTKTAARELAASGVTVNAVAPGLVESDLLSDMSAWSSCWSRNPAPTSRAKSCASTAAWPCATDAVWNKTSVPRKRSRFSVHGSRLKKRM